MSQLVIDNVESMLIDIRFASRNIASHVEYIRQKKEYFKEVDFDTLVDIEEHLVSCLDEIKDYLKQLDKREFAS